MGELNEKHSVHRWNWISGSRPTNFCTESTIVNGKDKTILDSEFIFLILGLIEFWFHLLHHPFFP